MRIVLTGAPGSGKSTAIQNLQSDYRILPDFSRLIIEHENIHPLADHLRFQERWLETMLNAFVENKTRTIFQYGLPDVIVYFKWRDGSNYKIPQQFLDAATTYRYDTILIMESIPEEFYARDKARTMAHADAIEIGKMTKQVYSEYGYDPICIPYLSVEERARAVAQIIEGAEQ